jgi:hypothetical protein
VDVGILFLGNKFAVVKKGCSCARNPIGQSADIVGMLLVGFGTDVVGNTVGQCFEGKFVSWYMTVLMALDPSDA